MFTHPKPSHRLLLILLGLESDNPFHANFFQRARQRHRFYRNSFPICKTKSIAGMTGGGDIFKEWRKGEIQPPKPAKQKMPRNKRSRRSLPYFHSTPYKWPYIPSENSSVSISFESQCRVATGMTTYPTKASSHFLPVMHGRPFAFSSCLTWRRNSLVWCDAIVSSMPRR